MRQVLKHKKILIAIFVVVVIADVIYGIHKRYLSVGEDKAVAEIVVVPAKTVNNMFDTYLDMLNSSSKDSISEGLAGMEKLAMEGNAEAMYQIAYTYVWAPADKISSERKKVLGLDVNEFGLLKSETKNGETVEWLEKTIQQDSTHFMAMYYLGFYYLHGFAVAQNSERAKELFAESKLHASNAQNSEYVSKIESTLSEIEKHN